MATIARRKNGDHNTRCNCTNVKQNNKTMPQRTNKTLSHNENEIECC